MSWPLSQHDHLTLPDGRPIGKVSTPDLMTMLVDFGTPGASHENGRETNIEAYAKHLTRLRHSGGTPAVETWFEEGRKRANPQHLAFETREDGVYVVEGWPPRVIFTRREIDDPPPWMVVNDSMITFGVKNGFASYRRGRQRGDGWLFTVSEHEFVK